ncbi:uncharacterized protein [Palaemon carinicauda]|uniref:uncharacterized protein n=1 Tax=Palaemon carinicauda TaxID=392227 RepID=UPI0035B60D03
MPAQEQILKMGLNCHFITRPRPTDKHLEMELLLDSILNFQECGALWTTDALQQLLLTEALTDRGRYTNGIVSKEMRAAAKELKRIADVTVRRADKTAAFVLISTHEHHKKLDAILTDLTKFERLKSNPVEDIKREANRTIEAINAATNAVHLPMISGDYGPGYLYERIKDVHSEGVIASMDVESLFTNVPVDETIVLIAERIYRDETTPEFNIPEQALRTLLAICTERAPFTNHRGHMYLQKDGVAMGSPLGVLFANFYMGVVEEGILTTRVPPRLLPLYCIDDTFVEATSTEAIKNLRRTFEDNSVLHFTVENSVDNSLPFLDVFISSTNEGFQTTVYTKPTNLGMCLNGESECPSRYRALTIKAFVWRALSHWSSWTETHKELERAAQVLINNGYSNKQVQQYQRDEKAIKDIITNNVSPTDETSKTGRHRRQYQNYSQRPGQQALTNIGSPINPERETSVEYDSIDVLPTILSTYQR